MGQGVSPLARVTDCMNLRGKSCICNKYIIQPTNVKKKDYKNWKDIFNLVSLRWIDSSMTVVKYLTMSFFFCSKHKNNFVIYL